MGELLRHTPDYHYYSIKAANCVQRKGNEMKELADVLMAMANSTGYGGTKAICPQCGGVAKVHWVGYRVKILQAECLGKEVAWERYENPCGFFEEVKEDRTAFDAAIQRLPSYKRNKYSESAKDRRIGRSVLWHTGGETDYVPD